MGHFSAPDSHPGYKIFYAFFVLANTPIIPSSVIFTISTSCFVFSSILLAMWAAFHTRYPFKIAAIANGGGLRSAIFSPSS